MKCHRRFKMRALRTPTHCTHTRQTVNSAGAMEETSGKVQNASTHLLQCRSRERAHTAVGQFKGQFKGAMDEM
jgi:hypothetical protein